MHGVIGHAHFSLSIDLDPSACAASSDSRDPLAEVTSGLLEITGRHGIAATWALSDPANSARTPSITRSLLDHELAILADRTWALADRTWAGGAAGAARFSRELFRRTESARGAGLKITTLALRETAVREHADLVAQAGLQVIRTAGSPASRLAGVFALPTVRLGICRVTTTARIPVKSNWSWKLTGDSTRRLLQAAIRENTSIHLVIEATRMIESPASGWRQIDRLLADANAARRAGQLRVGTLSELAELVRPAMTRVRSRSILRAA